MWSIPIYNACSEVGSYPFYFLSKRIDLTSRTCLHNLDGTLFCAIRLKEKLFKSNIENYRAANHDNDNNNRSSDSFRKQCGIGKRWWKTKTSFNVQSTKTRKAPSFFSAKLKKKKTSSHSTGCLGHHRIIHQTWRHFRFGILFVSEFSTQVEGIDLPWNL